MISDNELTKICRNPECDHLGERQSISNFYVRSGVENPTEEGHYNSECKDCLKKRSLTSAHLPAGQPREFSERLVIEYLANHHIPTLPGKAFKASNVDMIAWGCVRIEAKYSSMRHYNCYFTFSLTPQQKKRGLLADVVVLICDWGDRQTFHFFKPDDPFFTYLDGRQKSGFSYDPNRIEQKKHQENRVALTKPMMDAAENKIDLIETARLRIANELGSD